MIKRFLKKIHNAQKKSKSNRNLDNYENSMRTDMEGIINYKTDLSELMIIDTYYDTNYEIISEIHKGTNAVIYLIKNKEKNTLSVLKVHKKREKINIKYLSDIIHKQLDHQNIIKIHDYIESENYILILMEYIDNDLFNIIQEFHVNDIYISEFRASIYIEQIVNGMKYLYDTFKLIHRDIKPENILIDIDDNIKIIDFEYSTTNQHPYDICGTLDYIAPELYKKNNPYDYKIDIWSLGVLVYELLYNDVPLFDIKINHVHDIVLADDVTIEKFNNLEFPSFPTRSDTAKDFMKQLLNPNPSLRPTYDQILNHPFIANRPRE